MGCPARKRTPAFLRKAFLARSRTSNLVLPTSVSKVLGGRAGPSRSIISIIPLTGVANTMSWLPRTASAGLVWPRSIAALLRARSRTGARSQPMILPTNPHFFKAKARDPPIRPAPMIVIWRIGISCVHHRTHRHRESGKVTPGNLGTARSSITFSSPCLRVSVVTLFPPSGDLTADRRRNHAQLIHQLGELIWIERLKIGRAHV